MIWAVLIVICLVFPICQSASEEINFEPTNISIFENNIFKPRSLKDASKIAAKHHTVIASRRKKSSSLIGSFRLKKV
jgi:hypothetical protein